MLLDGGAAINVQNERGDTPLHDAIIGDNPDVVRLLLGRNADPSLKNKKGLDCHQLAQQRNPKMVQFLAQSRYFDFDFF